MDYPLSHNQITDSLPISLSEMNQQFPSRGGLCFYIRQTKADYPTTIYATYHHNILIGIIVIPLLPSAEYQKKFYKFAYDNKESFDAKNKEGYFYLAVRFAADT